MTTYNLLGIQFVENNGRNNIALVSSNWLTPRKQQTFWPPYKKQHQYEHSLKKGEAPTEKWSLYNIEKILFVEKDNDYHKAKRQLQFCEENSDIPSDFDTTFQKLNTINTQRIRKPPNRYCNTESSDEDRESLTQNELRKKSQKKINSLPRPPIILDSEADENALKTVTSTPQVVEKYASTSNSTSSILSENCIASTSSKKSSSGESLFQRQLLILLVEIKEQNTQVLALLKKKELNQISRILPADIPTLYLASLGGKNITTLTNKIMKFLYTDNFATKFSFFGKRGSKKPFSECLLKTAVVNAVKSCHLDATDRIVEDILKVWLKHAPQRTKGDGRELDVTAYSCRNSRQRKT